MLKDRRIQILAGLLIAQIALLAIVYWPRPTQATSAPLFPDLKTADVARLTISDKDGKSITLAQQAGNWLLPNAGDFPAQTSKVTALLDKVAGLKTNRLITQTPASHARLQVADNNFVRRLDLETTQGAKYTLYLGSAPRAGATHFRLAGQDNVYQVGNLSSTDAAIEPVGYIDATYLSFADADVTTLTVANAKGKLEFSKTAEGAWTLAELKPDQPLDAGQVQMLLNRIASVNLTRPLGITADPAWGLDKPGAVVTAITKSAQGEGKTYVLQIGAKDETTNNYYVKASTSPYYVQVASFSLDDFVNKAAADFIAAPTPTPAP